MKTITLKQARKIAFVAHAANDALRELLGEQTKGEFRWLSTEVQDRVVNGVLNALADPDLTPEVSHLAWMEAMQEDGWTHGPEEDLEAKKHPNLVAWERLTVEQQAKDRLFLAVVRALS